MKPNTSYQENYKTLPIATKLAYWPFLIGPILLIAGLCFLFIDSYFKTVIIASSLILVGSYEAFRRFRLKEIKKQRYTIQKPYAWQINAPEHRQHADFEMLKRQLIELQNTTNKSILFIIERVTPEDHQAHLYESIFQDLKKENIVVERFFQRGENELFWTEGYPDEISAEELTMKYGSWLPIFCTDGLRLIDANIESLSDAVFPFYAWKQPILLTNRPALSWSYEEELLSVIFTIISFNLPGVDAISKLIGRPSGLYQFHLPNEKPELIIKDDEQEIPQKLEAHFGKSLTRWIAATALCSKLDWDLTLKIGKYLSKNHDTPTDHTQLRQLSRLGWFRVGEMPEQVRKQLIEYLPISLQNEIRRLVVQAMEASAPPQPSHAHNSYRMELVSHKLLIPDFPQKNLKEEFFELKSMGYLEEVGASEIVNLDTGTFHKFLPPLLAERLYNNGNAMLGWNMKMFLPLIFLITSASAMVMDLIVDQRGPKSPTTSQLSGNIQGLFGNKVEGATVVSEFDMTTTDYNGDFKLDTPSDFDGQAFNVITKKEGYFNQSQTIEPNQGKPAITLLPTTVEIKVIDQNYRTRKINDAIVTLLTNASSDNSVLTKNGIATLPLKNKYDPADEFNVFIEKEGFKGESKTFQYKDKNKLVYLKEEIITNVPDPDISIRGRVTNQCNNPVEKVRVKVAGYPSVRTGRDGFFNLKIPNTNNTEELNFKLSKEDYYSYSNSYTSDQLGSTLTFKLIPKTIKIKVLDKDNKVIKGVKVKLNNTTSRTSNSNGTCIFPLEKDTRCRISIQIDHNGYHPIKEAFDLDEKTIVVNLDKKDTPVCKFIGQVQDNCNKPVKGATIKFAGSSTKAISSANGKATTNLRCNSIGNRFEISISKPGFHTEKKLISKNQLKQSQNVKLSRSNIKVKILHAVNKREIGGATVSLKDGAIGKMIPNGQYYNVPIKKGIGCQQTLIVDHKAYEPFSKRIDLGKENLTIELTPKRSYQFKGIITNQCGAVLGEAKVSLKGYPGSKRTAKDGTVNIGFTPPANKDKVTVVISNAGYHTETLEIKLNKLKTTQMIPLSRSKITVLVTNPNNKRLSGVRLRLGSNKSGTTDDNGAYIFNLKKGENCRQDLTAIRNGYESFSDVVNLRNGRISIKLNGKKLTKYEFQGTIINQCGKSIAEASVQIKDHSQARRTSKDGKISISFTTSKDKVDIIVKKSGFHREIKTISISEIMQPHQIKISKSSATILVTESKPNSKKIIGASIYVNNVKKGITNEQGECTIALIKNSGCPQQLKITKRGYTTYSNYEDFTSNFRKIKLINEREEAKPDITFEINVIVKSQAQNERIAVDYADGTKKVSFKNIKAGLYRFTLKRSVDPKLYDYIDKGGKLRARILNNIRFTRSQNLSKSNPKVLFRY